MIHNTFPTQVNEDLIPDAAAALILNLIQRWSYREGPASIEVGYYVVPKHEQDKIRSYLETNCLGDTYKTLHTVFPALDLLCIGRLCASTQEYLEQGWNDLTRLNEEDMPEDQLIMALFQPVRVPTVAPISDRTWLEEIPF